MKATRSTAKRTVKSKTKSAKVIQLNIFQQPQQKAISTLVNAIWGAVSTSLWPYKTFDNSEVTYFKELIAEHFLNGREAKRNFKEIIERVCLAKRYLARKRGRYISKPQDYLNVHYPLGLAGTAAWLQQVNVVRKDVPEYNKGISTLAKALIAFLDNPTILVYHKGRRQLLEQKQFDLLQIFNNTIIHLEYNS